MVTLVCLVWIYVGPVKPQLDKEGEEREESVTEFL
jgi:hypothetical protein